MLLKSPDETGTMLNDDHSGLLRDVCVCMCVFVVIWIASHRSFPMV